MVSHPPIKAVRVIEAVVLVALVVAQELQEDMVVMVAKVVAIFMLPKKAVRPMPRDLSTPRITEVNIGRMLQQLVPVR